MKKKNLNALNMKTSVEQNPPRRFYMHERIWQKKYENINDDFKHFLKQF